MQPTISYREVKKLLLNAIQMSGYAKDTEKSCAAWLVFRNSAGDKIVVARKNDYTLFFNPNIPGDKGDIVDFLLHRLNGGAVDTTITQKGNTERLQQALARAVGYTPAPIDAAKEQAAKIPATYSIQPLNAASTLPFDVAQLLRIRGIQPNILLQPDLAAEVGLLHVSGSRHTNLFFRWRDEQGNPAGGQYKYLNVQTKGTAKYFLPGTPRHGSVWSTSLENRCSLFVCEDPFDAIAYRQLNPNKNFALLATGGAITAEQISIIKSKARQAHMAVVLGNDNDIAGQVSNLKIVDETAKIVSIDAKQQTATIRHGGEPEKKVSLEELKEIVVQRCRQARCELYYAAPNHKKDWNEELLLSSRVKATPSPALKAALSSYQTAPCQPQPLTNSAHYHP
jgi:hypothetical protein